MDSIKISDIKLALELYTEMNQREIEKLMERMKNTADYNSREQLLPCQDIRCRNPHERAYRGCDICKYNKGSK